MLTKEDPVASGKSTRGRKPKGDRVQVGGKIPSSLKPVLEDAAEDMGLPLTDYIAIVLAEYHGQPRPNYLNLDNTNKEQEALPISA